MIDEKKLIEDLIPLLNEYDDMILSGRIIGIIDRQPKVSDWIPVSERLPEEPNYYEVTVDFGSKQITEVVFYSICESRWGAYNNDITAWRERLQEPYKAGEQE